MAVFQAVSAPPALVWEWLGAEAPDDPHGLVAQVNKKLL